MTGRRVHARRVGVLAALIFAAAPFASPAAAEPIMIASVPIEGGIGSPNVRFTLSFPRFATLFGQHVISSQDVGRVLVADASNEREFAPFVTRATNGRRDFIEWLILDAGVGGGGGVGFGGENVLFRLPEGQADFKGFTLTNLTLRIDSFTRNPNAPCPSCGPFLNATLAVFGEGQAAPVPEPATLMLVGSGFGAMLVRMRKRHHRGP